MPGGSPSTSSSLVAIRAATPGLPARGFPYHRRALFPHLIMFTSADAARGTSAAPAPGGAPLDVTVIMPVYNAQATLERSLASVTSQTRPPARIVIANDRSTDGSVELAQSLGLPNLDVVTLPQNGGCGAARNFGERGATTEFLAFLDADDEWAPTFLEEICAAMDAHGAGFGSSGGERRLAYRGAVSKRLLKDQPPVALDLTDSFWRSALGFMPIHPSSVVIRRRLYEEAGGFCGLVRNGEDTPLWAELWRRSRFVFVNKPLFTSVAPTSGLSAGTIAYSDVSISLGRVGRSLLRSLRDRRRGSGWFAIWFGATVIRRNALWVVRRVRRALATRQRGSAPTQG
jgi:glycosyltransferase involved in cell wall biosynthesis